MRKLNAMTRQLHRRIPIQHRGPSLHGTCTGYPHDRHLCPGSLCSQLRKPHRRTSLERLRHGHKRDVDGASDGGSIFLHERGFWKGVYFTSYFTGLFVGPIISGNISARHGWRSFFWLSLGLASLMTILLFFFSPETRYHRNENQVVLEDIAEQQDGQTQTADLKPESKHLEGSNRSDNIVGRGKPSRQQLHVFQRRASRWSAFFVEDLFGAARAMLFPIIFWAGLCVAGPANLLLFWNLTESEILSAPPNNFSISAVGYSNFAFMIGGFDGLFTAGPMGDYIAKRLTLRNDGVPEPEMRLSALIPYFITTAVGIVVGGLAAKNQWHWAILPVFGFELTGLSVTSIPAIAIAYAADCYKPIAGEIMVVATVLKNTCGFGMSFWEPSIVARQGYLTPGMVEFALIIGPMLFAVPLWFFGKGLRRLTRKSKVHGFEDVI